MDINELWCNIEDETPYGHEIVFVDNDGNWKHYIEVSTDDIKELIFQGFTKWCYMSDLIQYSYEQLQNEK